jgi:hypothetical protein
MFRKESDFEAFERVVVEAHLRQPIRILSYCVLSLAGGTADELDGSRQRSFDQEGIRPSAGEHRERTTLRRRDVGAGNGKRTRPGADRSSGRPPTESERIGERGNKLSTRVPSSGQIHRQTDRVLVSLPQTNRVLVSLPHRQTNRVPVSFPFTKGIRDVLEGGLRPGAELPQPTTSRTRACDASSTGVTPKRRLNSRLNCDGLS